MEILIVHLKSAKKAEALKSVMNALDVRNESKRKSLKGHYNKKK